MANKLLAEVPVTQDPQQLVLITRDAVFSRWGALADQARANAKGLLALDIDAVWTEQIETFVEFLAAWVEVDPARGGYREARRRVEAAITGRKNLRDFPAWQQQRLGAPPSSLDGARVSVLADPQRRDVHLLRRYRLAVGEQLDAIGVVKRCGGNPDQFVPIVNIAFAEWLSRAREQAPLLLKQLLHACRDVGIAQVVRGDLPCVSPLPFDASVLIPSRWQTVLYELGIAADPQRWGEQAVRPLLNRLDEPYPYVACLVADGDRMGAILDGMASADCHRTISRALAKFPQEARRIVEQEHLGSLVYAGGDDVLAFVPLPRALACAQALKNAFSSIMIDACIGQSAGPTLSIGIGIGHIMDGMGDLLALGRRAERLAKRDEAEGDRGRDRNGLGIVIDKRSGGTLRWRARWDDWNENPVGRLLNDAALLGERLSTKKVHEIGTALRRFPDPGPGLDGSWTLVLLHDVRRTIKRSETGEAAPSPPQLGLELDEATEYAVAHARIDGWVRRMLIAKVFAQAEPKPDRSQRVA
ncbi:MAG: type III-B CRISPR-associated protein Cas10/Cmr2 [Rhodospirillales bacterium]|nr:type III-B CRISPR-associated protein Cas10/Cmr2 [Rhodospirillales bacterium]